MNMEQFMNRVENADSAVELMGIFGEVNSPMLSQIGDAQCTEGVENE